MGVCTLQMRRWTRIRKFPSSRVSALDHIAVQFFGTEILVNLSYTVDQVPILVPVSSKLSYFLLNKS